MKSNCGMNKKTCPLNKCMCAIYFAFLTNRAIWWVGSDPHPAQKKCHPNMFTKRLIHHYQ